MRSSATIPSPATRFTPRNAGRPTPTPKSNGTNRPAATFVSGVDSTASNASPFNFGVTAPANNAGRAFITSGGNIYSPTSALTLTIASTSAATVETFNTVIFSLKTLGNPLNTAGVLLTLNTDQTIAPSFL
ncbi:MAG: hypothetical protein INR62_07865, partial [Rhodospirillales bacterium]|nr:hypothetical protein [Acetobacter sp.]